MYQLVDPFWKVAWQPVLWHCILWQSVPFHCGFLSSVERQTHRAEEIHTSTFLHPNIQTWHAAGAPHPDATLGSCLTRAMCRVFFPPNVLFFFQEVMNRCVSANGKKNNWWVWFPKRKVSLRSEPALASSDVESWKETSKMLFLFNRCHISFKTLETDSQEGFFPFLRLQINVACVLSLFYESTDYKRNM